MSTDTIDPVTLARLSAEVQRADARLARLESETSAVADRLAGRNLDAILERLKDPAFQREFNAWCRRGMARPQKLPPRRCKLAGGDKLTFADPGSSLVGVDEAGMSALFTISTDDVDREGDVILSSAFRGGLDSYAKNPIWLYAHAHDSVPIGSSRGPDGKLHVFIEEHRVLARCFFDKRDEDARFLFHKVADGFLRGTSVGFIPLRTRPLSSVPAKDMPGGRRPYPGQGVLVEALELLEISLAPLPMNAAALRLQAGDRITSRLFKALTEGFV